MNIQKNYDLTKLNTFGVSVRAKLFTEVGNEADLQQLFSSTEFKNNKKLFLGGGSNILFTSDYDGLVVLNKLKGIKIIKEDTESVLIQAMGGEVWQDLVEFAVSRNYWGIENLAAIPGSVGGAPVQNIGAYGADLGSVLENVETFDVENSEKRIFENNNYKHGYRESIFKNELKGRYFISAITLRLSKIPKPNLKYLSLKEYVEKNKINTESPQEISKAISKIRQEKLPDPKIINNAGSFFKNIIVGKNKFDEMLRIYPNMPHFKDELGVKIPTGWLIEECGWKGKRVGNVGVYKNHALVLVNHGGGTGRELKDLSEEIIDSVYKKFGLQLELEVNLI